MDRQTLTDGRTDGSWTDGRTDQWMGRQCDKEWSDGKTDENSNKKIKRQTDRPMDGRMYRQRNRQTKIHGEDSKTSRQRKNILMNVNKNALK
jgi:hypothetical protein